MRVLIYGGRKFKPTQEDLDGLYDCWRFAILSDNPWTVIISGKARGADSFGEDFAERVNLPIEGYPADWNGPYKKAAGFIRNQQMLDSGIDLAVQFPGGNGTADMRKRLDKAGVRVVEFHEE